MECVCSALFDVILAGGDYLSAAIIEVAEASPSNRLAIVLPSFGMDTAAQRHLRGIAAAKITTL